MIIFIVLGIISSIFQLTILRELTFSIAKNELSFVVAVGVWLMFCSLGSLLGFRIKFVATRYLAIASTLIFSICVVAIHLGKSLGGGSYYESSSLLFAAAASLFSVGPLSFFIGYCFAQLSRDHLNRHPSDTRTYGRFFAYEAVGFFIGGLVFTFLLSRCANPFVFSFFPVLFIAVLPLPRRERIIALFFCIALSFTFVGNYRNILEQELQQAQILTSQGSGYGPVIRAQRHDVESLYVNGSLVATSEDGPWREAFVHMSLSAHPNPKHILFIGTAYGGYVEELLKYRPYQIDCLDINPLLVRLSKEELSPKSSERVSFFIDDPRAYMQKSHKKYDYVIMNMPAPSSLSLNRFFTQEFFELVRDSLTEEGVFSFHIPSKRDILSPHYNRFNASITGALSKVFPQRFLIPSDSMIVIAGKDSLPQRERLLNNFAKRRMTTDYFSRYHFEDYLDPGHRRYIEEALDTETRINSDLNPVGFLYYLLLEQAKFYPNFSLRVEHIGLYIILVCALTVILVAALSVIPRKIFFMFNVAIIGFSSIGVTSILFVLFQMYSGALFWKMGILLGLFMIGLSAGSFLLNTIIDHLSYKHHVLVYFFCLWLIFVFCVFAALQNVHNFIVAEFIFYLCSILCGIFTGIQYPLITKCTLDRGFRSSNVAVGIYMADLIGAFIGTLAFSIFFIPFLGIFVSFCLLIGILGVFVLKSIYR